MTAAAATKKPAAKTDADEAPVLRVPLKQIESNTVQSRGMGVLSTLKELGYGLFEKIDPDHDPIWPDLVGDDRAKAEAAATLIDMHEPGIVEFATSLKEHGQLQPAGVVRDKNAYDVVFGMRRILALAYNRAKDPKAPDYVAARIAPAAVAKDTKKLKLWARTENRVREGESPVDLAMYYASLKKDDGMTVKEIADSEDKSEQHVKDYLSLLDPKLKDYRQAIHNREKSVDWAVKHLRELKASASADAEGRNGGANGAARARFPSVKTIETAYKNNVKPKSMDDKVWEFYKDETVRRFLAVSLGFKFKPYAEPKAAKAGVNGQAAPDGKKRVFNVPRTLAKKLLLLLGKTNAETFTDPDLKAKLENITEVADVDTKVEDKGAQDFLDKLLNAVAEGGFTVTITDGKKK